MSKKAYFLVTSSGMDGREPETIQFATDDEAKRDRWHEEHTNKNYHSTADRVYDLEKIAKQAWLGLSGIEKLALLQVGCPVWKRDYPHWGKNAPDLPIDESCT